MQVLRDQTSIASVPDLHLRSLIERCVASLSDFDDCNLAELVTFIVVEPGDSVEAIDDALVNAGQEPPLCDGEDADLSFHSGALRRIASGATDR